MDDPDQAVGRTLERVRGCRAEHRPHVDQGQVGHPVHDGPVPEAPEGEGAENPGEVQSLKEGIKCFLFTFNHIHKYAKG